MKSIETYTFLVTKCIKSDFKEIDFKLATNAESDKAFLFTSKFCLQGVVCPCPEAVYCTCTKSLKNVYTIKEILYFYQEVVCPCPGTIYTCLKL